MGEGIRSSKTSVKSTLSQAVKTLNAKLKALYKKKSTARVAEESGNLVDKSKVLTYEDLQLLTNNFSPHNYMGRTHFGHLYKGIIPEDWKGKRSGEVTNKMWKNEQFLDKDCILPHSPGLVRHSMKQEIKFLQQPDISMHPYTVNVMGYCLEDNNLGVVYDLKPLHTLKNYIDNFADLNPFLIDYAMIHGGSFVDLLMRLGGGPCGSHGYVSANELMIGSPTKRSDIHAYGVILLEIIRQCTYTNNRESKLKKTWTEDFAWRDYVRYKEMLEEKSDGSGTAAEEDYSYSFAHESMRNDTDYDARDGNKISILGLRCVEKLMPPIRSMGQVLEELKELKVVQSHPELLLLDDDQDL